MRVVVTGGSGHAGAFIVQDLVEHGYEVLSVDRVKPARPVCRYRFANLEDLGQVYGCLHDAEAVVHFAAIPRPIYDNDEVVFRTNTMTTFNVLEAAAQLGIPRVVLASSMSVLGYPFYYHYFAPDYVPIDEAHPLKPQDPYAMSKVVGEVMAQAFARRAPIMIISLRLGWIHTPETFKQQIVPFWDNPGGDAAANLWGYIDSRDAAQACRRALETSLTGHEAFFIAAPNTFMKTPTADLMRQFYPETKIPEGLEGNWALLSSAKAERMLGFHAQHLWDSYF
ncbi:MAG TPA: NAD(P)-dependent oxidoreductase [Anaerolineae bacterium]|nr:NAD(P)-dependent oxidoreductase [Anaerolineae bacterium]